MDSLTICPILTLGDMEQHVVTILMIMTKRYVLKFMLYSWYLIMMSFLNLKVLVTVGGKGGGNTTEILFHGASSWVYGDAYPINVWMLAGASIDNNIITAGENKSN